MQRYLVLPMSFGIIIAFVVAGLGLFFTGTRFVHHHLEQIVTPRIRLLLSTIISHRPQAAASGFCIGAFVQNTGAMTAIVVSMIKTGLLTQRSALTFMNWFSPGSCLFVFIVVLPFHAFYAWGVGIFGLCYALGIPRRFQNEIGLVFGLSLILFGLYTIQSHAQEFQNYEWFKNLLAMTAGQ